jgi:hypothetical protein
VGAQFGRGLEHGGVVSATDGADVGVVDHADGNRASRAYGRGGGAVVGRVALGACDRGVQGLHGGGGADVIASTPPTAERN